MKLIKSMFLIGLFLLASNYMEAQTISKEQMIFLTSEWKGERFSDGRPRVADDILERFKGEELI